MFCISFQTGGVYEIVKIAAPRCKVYLYITKNLETGEEDHVTKLKGTPGHAVEAQITWEDFENAIFENTSKFCNYQRIQSKSHKISTVKINKKALSGFTDKRHLSEFFLISFYSFI